MTNLENAENLSAHENGTGRVADHLRAAFDRMIENGTLGSTDRLPSERVLSEKLGVARMTVRKALWQLEAEGKIFRAERSGWYLSAARFIYDPTRDVSFTAAACRQGRQPGSKLLALGEIAANSAMAEGLNVEVNTPLIRIVRLRSLDGRPVFVERSHVLKSRCPQLDELAKKYDSLSVLYEAEYGIHMNRKRITMHPTALDVDDAQPLRVPAGTPGLHLRRSSADQHGQLFTWDIEAWLHDALAIDIRP